MEIFEVPKYELILDGDKNTTKVFYTKREGLAKAREAVRHGHTKVELREVSCIFLSQR